MLLDSIVKVTTLLCGSWHGFENALQVFFGPVQYWWLPSIHCQHLACQCLHAFWDCYRALLRPGKTPILQWPTSFYISHMMPDDGWIDELLLHLKDMLLFSFFFGGLTMITIVFIFAVDFFSGDAAYILLLPDSTGLFFQNLCNWQTSIFVKGTHQSLLLESSCGASSIIPFPSCQTERGFSLCDDQWPDLLALAMQAMQRYYRATSRELRRLDSVSRSHVYTTFTEVLDGSGTIRAFKAQVETLSPVPPKLSSSPKKVNPHTMIKTLGKTTLYQLTRRNPNL